MEVDNTKAGLAPYMSLQGLGTQLLRSTAIGKILQKQSVGLDGQDLGGGNGVLDLLFGR